jgi:ribosomal protein L12E/L44/L45/RPP1/RPP2
MDIPKITSFVNQYLAAVGALPPGGADGNLLTNYVDDGKNEKKEEEKRSESSEEKESSQSD